MTMMRLVIEYELEEEYFDISCRPDLTVRELRTLLLLLADQVREEEEIQIDSVH